ncbi:type IV pilus assembly protein PilM [Pseudomonas sp. RA_35y_Pfl2_P32]|uniref:type IV pilus assembly protein PilM n=1 Tax=Pseudomonas sp. RA_35y_Pfl2_P32 TaxID=3088705 RepID=UPI0030DB6312
MPRLFRKKPSTLLGIDIAASSVRLVELSRSGACYRLDAYATETLPANAVVEAAIVEVEAVGQALARVWLKAGTRVRSVAVAVSGSAVITKTLEMPAGLSSDDLESQLKLDADQYIPYPLDEMALDFQVLGVSRYHPGRVEVLLAACRKDHVEQLEAALELAGLKAQVVDVQAHALVRCVERLAAHLGGAREQPLVALVDTSNGLTTLRVIGDGQVLYARELLLGARQLTQAGEPSYEFVLEPAELTTQPGGQGLRSDAQVLAQQVSRSLQEFFALGRHGAVEHILLAAEAAAVIGLDRLLEQYLGTPARVANPFAGMALGSGVDAAALAHDAPGLVVACGLALRSFD